MRTDDVASRARNAPQRPGRARPVRSDALLDQSPRRFDRVEVMRVRRQKPHGRAALFDELANGRRLVRIQVIEQDDIPAMELGREPGADPVLEADVRHAAPAGPERDPARHPHRPDQRQVVAPIHGAWFHELLAPLNPCMRTSHRDIDARFIDRHPSFRVDRPDRRAECLAFGGNVGSVKFTRTWSFFLSTYPARFSARRKLVALVRPARPTRRLYARLNSSLVPSGRSRTTAWTTMMSMGDRQPPPRGRGAIESVARYWATHRSSVRYPIPNSAANSWYPPSPASYAATARPRNATSYGFGMASVKYSSCVNSSGFRD